MTSVQIFSQFADPDDTLLNSTGKIINWGRHCLAYDDYEKKADKEVQDGG